MISSIKNYLLIAVFVLLSTLSQAQWSQLDYSGGYVFRVIKINKTLFSQTRGGIYKSLDSGNTWLSTNNDAALKLFGIASFVDMSSSAKIFSFGDALYYQNQNVLLKSVDAGDTWLKFSFPPKLKFIDYFYLNDTLFAFTGSEDQKIYKLIANNWILQSHSSSYHELFQTNGSFIYSYNNYAPQQGLYKSTNASDFVKVSMEGIPKNDSLWLGNYYYYYYDVFTFCGIENSLFAIANDSMVFRSIENGTWSRTKSGLPPYIRFIHNLESNDQSVYIRFSTAQSDDEIYRTDDKGENWYKSDLASFMQRTKIGNRLIRPSNNGVFYSDNNGLNWHESNAGLKSTYVYFMKAYGNKVFSYDYNRATLVYSMDHGQSWRMPKGMEGTGPLDYTQFVFLKNEAFVICAKGVFHSTDSGETWASFEYPKQLYYVGGVGLNENGTTFFFTLDSAYNKQFYRTNDYVIYENITASLPLPSSEINDIIIHKKNWYAWSYVKSKIYKSSDNGLTWNLDVDHLPITNRFKYNTLEIIENKLVLSVFDSYYLVLPRIYIKEDTTWVRQSCNHLPKEVFMIDVVGNRGTLYTADYFSKSVYYSEDFGQNWMPMDTLGLSNAATITVYGLAVTDDGIYVGTHNAGIWKHEALKGNEHITMGLNTPAKNNQITVFPNPVTTALSVKGIEMPPTFYQLINANGVVSQEGKFSERINVENLADGFYFLLMYRNGHLLHTEKIQIQK